MYVCLTQLLQKTSKKEMTSTTERCHNGHHGKCGADNPLCDFHTPPRTPIEKITIVPSGRIDWCSACQKDHGYDCPLDTPPVRGWEEEFAEIVKGRKQSKYHRNYIATHVVETFIRSTLKQTLEDIKGEIETKIARGELWGSVDGFREVINNKLKGV